MSSDVAGPLYVCPKCSTGSFNAFHARESYCAECRDITGDNPILPKNQRHLRADVADRIYRGRLWSCRIEHLDVKEATELAVVMTDEDLGLWLTIGRRLANRYDAADDARELLNLLYRKAVAEAAS